MRYTGLEDTRDRSVDGWRAELRIVSVEAARRGIGGVRYVDHTSSSANGSDRRDACPTKYWLQSRATPAFSKASVMATYDFSAAAIGS
ncbi:MAG TPA: hypothetical protein QGH10_04580, partial [Armatimonadota bacterium]|nr:hypothetical protein [Armatimonadota bacterium]